jgi:hypothetical protein
MMDGTSGVNGVPSQQQNPANDNAVQLDDADFDTYSDLDLVRLHEELTKRNVMMEAENKLFESYLVRVNPHVLKGDHELDGRREDGQGDGDKKDIGRERKKKKGEKAKEADKPILLTPEQKAEIATRELEELKDEIEKQKEEWGKVLDNYKVHTG